jgi:myosin heavy subunit
MQSRRRLSNAESPAINGGFAIHHYAGVVDYTTKGWLDKNNDRLLPECEALIREAQKPLVRSLGDEDRSSTSFRSVSKRYSADLQSLLQKLSACQLHYIRCFKPNNQQAEKLFDETLVKEQIIHCGTVELVRIMHDGFPNRMGFDHLMQRYKAMLPPSFERYGARTFMEALMRVYDVPPHEWAVGFTRLFLKAGRLQLLEKLRDQSALPEADHVAKIIRDTVRRRWRRATQAICLCLWMPKFVAELREERTLRRVAACRRWRGASIAIRWCLREARLLHAKRRDRQQLRLYHAVSAVLIGRAWVCRARASLEAKREEEAAEAELTAEQVYERRMQQVNFEQLAQEYARKIEQIWEKIVMM